MKKISERLSIPGVILTISGVFIIGYLLHGHILALQVEKRMEMETKVESKVETLNTDSTQMCYTENSPKNSIDSFQNTQIPNTTQSAYGIYSLDSLPQSETDSTAAETPETSSWQGDTDNPKVFARMTIPKIDLIVPVVEGVEKADIKLAIGHVPETGMPGEPGNSAYAGHRSHTYGKFFHRLGEVGMGDEIIVETKLYKYKYIVTEKFKVNPDEVWVYDEIPGKTTITLITCEPLYGNKYRLIVRGLLEDM